MTPHSWQTLCECLGRVPCVSSVTITMHIKSSGGLSSPHAVFLESTTGHQRFVRATLHPTTSTIAEHVVTSGSVSCQAPKGCCHRNDNGSASNVPTFRMFSPFPVQNVDCLSSDARVVLEGSLQKEPNSNRRKFDHDHQSWMQRLVLDPPSQDHPTDGLFCGTAKFRFFVLAPRSFAFWMLSGKYSCGIALVQSRSVP